MAATTEVTELSDTNADTAEAVPDTEPTPPRNRRRLGLIALIVLAIVLIGGGVWLTKYETVGKYQETTNNAYIQSDSVVISPKIAGYVDKVFVADNQAVAAGAPLLQIDPREYRAQAAQIQAQIDIARTSAAGALAQILEQQAGVAQARAQVAAAQSALAFARSEVARYTPLAQTGAEPGEKLAQLRNQQRQAEAQLAQMQAGLVAAQRRAGTLQTQVEQARSQGRAAEAQLAAANVNVGSTLVRAPIGGRIANKTVQMGQLVQPGTRLMTVVPLDKLYVEANFKETQLALMRPGQPVTITVDALDGVELHGKVESVQPGTGAEFSILPAQNATGNFTKIVQRVPVRISLDAGPMARKLLVPGMSVEVTVDTRSARNDRAAIERDEAARAGK